MPRTHQCTDCRFEDGQLFASQLSISQGKEDEACPYRVLGTAGRRIVRFGNSGNAPGCVEDEQGEQSPFLFRAVMVNGKNLC